MQPSLPEPKPHTSATGAAVCRFLYWLEHSWKSKNVSELSAVEKLASLRAESKLYRGDSFDTIAGFADHGAIVHYRVTPETDYKLRAGIFLIDSGGQYLDGTTDITRTVLLGNRCTRWQRECFTRVLKGHIALATTRFPQGTTGPQLDTIARTALWQIGQNYAHGTGHGVGSYLCVHEGPQSFNANRAAVPLDEGNILSNEPGYYEAGKFGIRIENLVCVEKDETHSSSVENLVPV